MSHGYGGDVTLPYAVTLPRELTKQSQGALGACGRRLSNPLEALSGAKGNYDLLRQCISDLGPFYAYEKFNEKSARSSINLTSAMGGRY
jgi:hypothetical protein